MRHPLDPTLSEDIAAITATVAALIAAGLAVAGVITYGPVRTAALLAVALVTLATVRYVVGRALRPATVRARRSRPHPVPYDPDDDTED